jgi:hypothetical protein
VADRTPGGGARAELAAGLGRRSSGGRRCSGGALGRSSRRAWAGAAVRRPAGAGAGGGGDPMAGGGGEFVSGVNWIEPRRQETRREKGVCGFFLARRQDLWRRARCHAGRPRHEARRHNLWRRDVLPRRHSLWRRAKGTKLHLKFF